jgi:hypothetical protein
LAGRRFQSLPRLQAQRASLAYDGGSAARMQGLFHDAQDLVVLPAIDPDDARGIKPEADEAGQIAVGAARSPKCVSFPDA